jgi:hypothetical protein
VSAVKVPDEHQETGRHEANGLVIYAATALLDHSLHVGINDAIVIFRKGVSEESARVREPFGSGEPNRPWASRDTCRCVRVIWL